MQRQVRMAVALLLRTLEIVPAISRAVILTAVLTSPTYSQTPSGSLFTEVVQLRQLLGAGDFREVTRRAPTLATNIKKQWSSKDYHDLYVITIRTEAVAHARLGEVKQAEALFNEAIDISKKDHGPNDPALGPMSADLGYFYNDNGRPADAVRYFNDAIRIYKENNPQDRADDNIINLSSSLAPAYAKLGDNADAERVYKDLISIYTRKHGSNDATAANYYNELGTFYQNIGRSEDAAPFIKRALDIIKAVAPESPGVITYSNNLAAAYSSLGRNSEAEQLYKDVISTYTRQHGSNDAAAALYLNNLGTFYVNIGRFADAVTFLKRGVDITKAVAPSSAALATYSNNLASAYLNLSQIDEAITNFEQAINYEQKAHGPNSGALYYNNLGMLYFSLWKGEKDSDKKTRWHMAALDNLTKALDHELKTITDTTDLAAATYRMNLGLLATADGRYNDAQGLIQQVLTTREQKLGGDDISVAVPLSEWAWLDVVRDQVTSTTLERSRRAVQIMTPVLERELRLQQGRDAPITIQPWATHVKVLYRAIGLGLIGQDGVGEAFEAAQRARPTAISAAVNQTMARTAAANPAIGTLVREHQDLTAQLNQIEAQLLSEIAKPAQQQDAQQVAAIRAKIAFLTMRMGQLNTELARAFPNYSNIVAPRPVSLVAIQRILGQDEAMIFYYRSDRGDYVWAITREEVAWRELDLSTASLDTLLTEWRASFDNAAVYFDNQKPFDVASAHRLYASILAPVANVIGKKSNLVVVASGLLATFPFHLLVTESPPRPVLEWRDYRSVAWLARKYAITTLSSPVSLILLRKPVVRADTSKPYLGFGDPIFSDPSQRLTDTAEEVKAAAQIFGVPENIRLERDATVRAVKTTQLSDYRILHFATHGYTAEETKRWGGDFQPSLALTHPQVASDEDDGFLTASEIMDLKLNADLVVMSACESAAADKSGEALSGLARSFFYAGARALMVSYWEVDSKSAERLITQTLELLKQSQGLSPAQALRQAMIKMIDDPSVDFNAYPGMWAPFGVLGLETRLGTN